MIVLTFLFPSHQYLFVNSEITLTQMSKKKFKKTLSNLDSSKPFENLPQDKNIVLLHATLLNIFREL